jgi:hypothetical protein
MKKEKKRLRARQGKGANKYHETWLAENRTPPWGTMADKTGARISRPTFVGMGRREISSPWAHTPYRGEGSWGGEEGGEWHLKSLWR